MPGLEKQADFAQRPAEGPCNGGVKALFGAV